MFELNPLNLPEAQIQHVIMLSVTGLLGFIIGYVSRQRVVRQLEEELASTEQAVDDCQQIPVVVIGTGNEETSILNRIRARASQIDFVRIGTATAAEGDDLKVIVGVGPFLEKKLHAAGIYTFRQIANFNDEDVNLVNDIIEFFPGRIQRDNWVGQAKDLAKK